MHNGALFWGHVQIRNYGERKVMLLYKKSKNDFVQVYIIFFLRQIFYKMKKKQKTKKKKNQNMTTLCVLQNKISIFWLDYDMYALFEYIDRLVTRQQNSNYFLLYYIFTWRLDLDLYLQIMRSWIPLWILENSRKVQNSVYLKSEQCELRESKRSIIL